MVPLLRCAVLKDPDLASKGMPHKSCTQEEDVETHSLLIGDPHRCA